MDAVRCTQAQQKPEVLAQTSAEAWLALTDSGKYGESWDQAASTFKGAVSRDQWVSQLTESPPRSAMNGFEATGKIRSSESLTGGHVPMLALTANAFDEDRNLCLDAGMRGFLTKPAPADLRGCHRTCRPPASPDPVHLAPSFCAPLRDLSPFQTALHTQFSRFSYRASPRLMAKYPP
jgi:CheY-like chemotaxis protein